MQRFTLLHDGSAQAWQAIYLAFHIAAQLGAPLRVLLFDSNGDQDMLAKNASQIEVGGHAAGVNVRTHLLPDYSVDRVVENSLDSNGFFMPQRLIIDEKTAVRYLESISCPLWVVSKTSELKRTILLVSDLAADTALINFAANLANRIKRPLTGFIRESELKLLPDSSADITWLPLADFSTIGVEAAINKLGESLLFLSARSFSLVKGFYMNCVFYPETSDA